MVIDIARGMKESGLLNAGYNYITLGGMGFAENGDPQSVPGFPHIPPLNITRNASGYLQVDASRFPGPGSTAACLDAKTVIACRRNVRGHLPFFFFCYPVCFLRFRPPSYNAPVQYGRAHGLVNI